jgi:hypothetical protein
MPQKIKINALGGLHHVIGRGIARQKIFLSFLEEGDDRVTAAKQYGAIMKPFQVEVKLAGRRN